MGECKLERLVLVMNDVIELFFFHSVADEIFKAVFGIEALGSVEIKGEPAVEVGIHPETFFDEFGIDMILREDLRIGNKFDEGSVALGGVAFLFLDEFSVFEFGAFEFAFAECGCDEAFGEGVDRLCADAVQTDGELEDIAVVFCARVDLGNAVHKFLQRNAASVVADFDVVVAQGDVDAASAAHDEFVDGVVDNLFDEDVYAVVFVCAVSEFSDIHSGPVTDVFERA